MSGTSEQGDRKLIGGIVRDDIEGARREADRRVEAAKAAATKEGLAQHSLEWWSFTVWCLHSAIEGYVLDIRHVQQEAREDLREANHEAAQLEQALDNSRWD